MRLLIITQKVDTNDDILGFFHRWVEEFAKYFKSVIVICLQKGDYNLPENVKALSLGKEKSDSKIKYLFNFYKYIWQERKNYDAVFIHMNPEYAVLGGLFWKLWNKKIGLWYTHKAVNLKLRIAEKLADKIFTASKESFRLNSKKIIVTGHGIDTERFKPSDISHQQSDKLKIISVGRITPIKNYEVLINAAEILKNGSFPFEIKIAGAAILNSDKIYLKKLRKMIEEKNLNDRIALVGSVPYKNITDFFREGDLFVNFSDTGSIDKAVLEAMSCGLNILTSNEAFKNILSDKYFTDKIPNHIAEKIIAFYPSEYDSKNRDYVIKNHNLGKTIGLISAILNE